MDKKRTLILSLGFGLLAISSAMLGYAQVGGGYDLSWSTVDGGGGTFSTGGGYSLGGTIGQPDAGSMSGGGFAVQGGFWAGAGGSTPNATPTSTAQSTSTRTNTPPPTSSRTSTSVPTATQTNIPLPTSTGTRTNTAIPTFTRTSTTVSTSTSISTSTSTAVATVTSTGTPTCIIPTNYTVITSTSTLTPGTSLVPGSTCDDCAVSIALPFPYSLYGTTYTQASASNKGVLQFGAGTAPIVDNACLPTPLLNSAIAVFWDNLNTNINDVMGIYTRVMGTAPNRTFIVQWRGGYIANDITVNFEVILYEGQEKFDLVYGTSLGAARGNFATIGVQQGTGPNFTQYSCNTASVQTGRRITFQRTCGAGP